MRQPNAPYIYDPARTALQVLLMPSDEAQKGKALLSESGRGEGLGDFLLRNLEPTLGTGINWETVLKSLRRVEYEGNTQRVSIAFQDGTRMDQTLATPTRPGSRTDARAREQRTHSAGQSADGAGDQVRAVGPRRD